MATEPQTLQEAMIYFADPDNALNYYVARRWPSGVECPTCGSKEVHFLANQRRWECKGKHPKRQFSAKVGSIFEDSAIPLEKWLCAVWMITNCKNGVSSYEIQRAIGVTQKTAWFILHRVRLGMQDKVSGGKLSGEVEVDETFIGGKARNMHMDVKARKIQGRRGPEGKAIVAAVLERGGKVRRCRGSSPQNAVTRAGARKCRTGRCPLLRCAEVLRWVECGVRASGCRPRH